MESNKIVSHLVENGMTDLQAQRYEWLIKAVFEAGVDYLEDGVAGSLVEAVAQLWADLCLDGLHECTDPYSLYSLAIQEGVA